MPDNIIHAMESLYRELPEINCTGCGQCCVAPTCTLSEWIYLFNGLCRTCDRGVLGGYLDESASLHAAYDGNVHCPFLAGTRCAVHPVRTGACRLFGIPSLNLLGIEELEECRQGCSVVSGDGSALFVKSWLRKLVALDASLYAFDTEPYYITGFTIQCWNDIYFDDTLDFDVFRDIRAAMRRYCDLSFHREIYAPKTRIREKIDKIGILSAMLGTGDAALLKNLLLSIRDDYPETGTCFHNEASAFLDRLDSGA